MWCAGKIKSSQFKHEHHRKKRKKTNLKSSSIAPTATPDISHLSKIRGDEAMGDIHSLTGSLDIEPLDGNGSPLPLREHFGHADNPVDGADSYVQLASLHSRKVRHASGSDRGSTSGPQTYDEAGNDDDADGEKEILSQHSGDHFDGTVGTSERNDEGECTDLIAPDGVAADQTGLTVDTKETAGVDDVSADKAPPLTPSRLHRLTMAAFSPLTFMNKQSGNMTKGVKVSKKAQPVLLPPIEPVGAGQLLPLELIPKASEAIELLEKEEEKEPLEDDMEQAKTF